MPLYRKPGHTIEDEGTPVVQRPSLNFAGAGVSVADSGGKSVVTIAGGGGSGIAVTQVGHGLAVGDVIRYSGSAYVEAKADSAANAEAVGIVSAVADADNFTYLAGGSVTGLSGLTAGTVYFLSPTTAGLLTATEPSAAGQVSKPLLIATSTTAGILVNFRGLLVGEALTVPVVISVGAEFSGTGVPTATLPGTHTTNDVLGLVIETANQAFATPAGYTRLGPANGVGDAGAAAATKLFVFWKRDGGSEAAPTLSDSGDHTYGFMFAMRGCPTVGDPFHLLDQAWKFTASTTGTSGKGVTCVDNCLVMDIFAHAIDSASAQGSSPTNSTLTNVTEQFDDSTQDGNNGGLYMMTGTKAEAGDVGASTVTWATSTADVSTRIAWLPEQVTAEALSSRPVEVQKFIGSSADLDDTWVKAVGARRVMAQVLDGGGSGSGGRSAATAEGGGGGGGGGYDEAWFVADDLAATVTVHAGKGGASVAVDAAGNPGVLSEFDKGNAGPLTSTRRIAGTAATATISADAGNGGCGSGRGTASPAVAAARIDLTAATAGAALGAVGGRGGSGTTATIGGSPADWGGGGGEMGGDSDASIAAANNGWSLRGGGGGGGGRTGANIGGGAMGGGAAAPAATQGQAGVDSSRLPYGGSGACGGGSTTAAGGTGGFPGGGGGGGGGVASGSGGRGGHGIVFVTTVFS